MEWHNFILHETNISKEFYCENIYFSNEKYIVPTKLFFITKLQAHHRTSDKRLKQCSRVMKICEEA